MLKPKNTKKENDTQVAKENKTNFSEEAAVYEKSDNAVKTNPNKLSKAERKSLVAQMQADAEANKAQLLNIVRNEITRQGQAIGESDNITFVLSNSDSDDIVASFDDTDKPEGYTINNYLKFI